MANAGFQSPLTIGLLKNIGARPSTAFAAFANPNTIGRLFAMGVPGTRARADVGDGGRPRPGAKRLRFKSADERLTEGEVQWMQRKLAELRKAKTEREAAEAAQAIEIALAQAAQDDEAAEVITAAIEQAQPGRVDYAAALRDTKLIGSILTDLRKLAKQLQAERDEDDDIEILLLSG